MRGWFRRSQRRRRADDALEELRRTSAERAGLIELCLYALDRSHSPAVAERLSEGLDRVGVVAVRPDGEDFDPACHDAGGTVDTDDPTLDGRIATTELPGFVDRQRVVRAPVVTVYRLRDEHSG